MNRRTEEYRHYIQQRLGEQSEEPDKELNADNEFLKMIKGKKAKVIKAVKSTREIPTHCINFAQQAALKRTHGDN